MQNLQKQHLFCICPGYKVPGKTSKEALHSLRAKGDIFFYYFFALKLYFSISLQDLTHLPHWLSSSEDNSN